MLLQYDVIVDVREPDEVAAGYIINDKTVHVPLGQIIRDMKSDAIQQYKVII